jgi:sugar O-acyltransferase (sialic acid O-acetyltransferase NeuD family)
MNKDIYIIGAGGLGREVASIITNKEQHFPYVLKGFIDDGLAVGTNINGLPVIGGIDDLKDISHANIFVAIGNPIIRKKIIDNMQLMSLDFPNLIHRTAVMEDILNTKIGSGVFIGSGVIMTTNIQIGNHTFIHSGSILHHDTHIGNNCVVMPGVRITSKCKIGNHSYIGTGSIIAKEIELAPFSYIPAGTIISGEESTVKINTIN